MSTSKGWMKHMRTMNLLQDRTYVEELRRLTTEFFDDSIVVATNAPMIQAKVHMRTNEHDPHEYHNVIARIRLYCSNTDGTRQNLGNVAIPLNALLVCDVANMMPSVDNYMRGKTGLSDEKLDKALLGIGEIVKQYAQTFDDVGPEPVNVAETRERMNVEAFLTGKVAHEIADCKITAEMPVSHYDYMEFEHHWATVEITRLDGSLVGRLFTTMGRIYKSGIQSFLDEFELDYSELIDIDDHMMQQLQRFEYLGPVPVISRDLSYDNNQTVESTS